MPSSIIYTAQQRENAKIEGIAIGDAYIQFRNDISKKIIAAAFAQVLHAIRHTVQAKLVRDIITVKEAKEAFIEEIKGRRDWAQLTDKEQDAILHELEVAAECYTIYEYSSRDVQDLLNKEDGDWIKRSEPIATDGEQPAVSTPTAAPTSVPAPASAPTVAADAALTPVPASAPITGSAPATAAATAAPPPSAAPVQANGIGSDTPDAKLAF